MAAAAVAGEDLTTRPAVGDGVVFVNFPLNGFAVGVRTTRWLLGDILYAALAVAGAVIGVRATVVLFTWYGVRGLAVAEATAGLAAVIPGFVAPADAAA